MTFDLHTAIIFCNKKFRIGDVWKNYTFLESLWKDKQFDTIFIFSDKLEHVSIFDPCKTFKVHGSHLGNATICGISGKCCLCFAYTLCQISHFYQILHNNANFLCLAALVYSSTLFIIPGEFYSWNMFYLEVICEYIAIGSLVAETILGRLRPRG